VEVTAASIGTKPQPTWMRRHQAFAQERRFRMYNEAPGFHPGPLFNLSRFVAHLIDSPSVAHTLLVLAFIITGRERPFGVYVEAPLHPCFQ
jgi:hypothetical protein